MARFPVSILALLLLLGSCVERRLTVLSDPPGARVFLDDRYIGETPLSTSFDFYGTREIMLYREGYLIFCRMEEISPPLYQLFPLDFLAEFLLPFHLCDEHRMEYTLKPHLPLNQREREALIERSDALRREITKNR